MGGFIPHPPQWGTFALEAHPRKALLDTLGESVNPQLEGYTWDISIKCKVGALLNKITSKTFNSISRQVVLYANLSESEATGSTLLLVIQAIVDKAKFGAMFSDLYANLCRRLMDNISLNVQVFVTSNGQQEPISGRAFFQARLLRLCQIEFERRWLVVNSDRQPTALHRDGLYTAAKMKRQRISAARFMGELFRAGIAADAIVRQCITMLLWNTVSPEVLLDTTVLEDDMVESVCALLTAAGKKLDHGETREHMNGYFGRIKEIAGRGDVSSRARFKLQVSASLEYVEVL